MYMYIHIHTYRYSYICICTRQCRSWAISRLYTYKSKTYIDIHLYIFIYLHTCIYIHTYTYTYSYTYKHIYQAVPGLSHMSFWSSLSRVRAVSNGSSRSIPNSYMIYKFIKYIHIHVRVYTHVSLCKLAPCLTARLERWGAGVETHFQEI